MPSYLLVVVESSDIDIRDAVRSGLIRVVCCANSHDLKVTLPEESASRRANYLVSVTPTPHCPAPQSLTYLLQAN